MRVRSEIQFHSVKEPVDLKYFPEQCPCTSLSWADTRAGTGLPAQSPFCPGTHKGPPDTDPQQLGVPSTALQGEILPAHSQRGTQGPWHSRNKLQAGPRQGEPPSKRRMHWRRMGQEAVKYRLWWRQDTPPAPCATGKCLQGKQKTATVKHFSPFAFISQELKGIFVTTERNTCWLQQLLNILYNTIGNVPAVPALSCRCTKIHCNVNSFPQILFPHPTTNSLHQTVKLDK